MRTLIPLLALARLLFATPASAQAPDSLLLAARAALYEAMDAGEAAAIVQARARMERIARQGLHPTLARYYTAHADARLLNLDPEGEQAERYHDRAIETLEQVIEAQPGFADAHALLSSLYGQKATGMLGGMRYGPKASRAMKEAQRLAPDNPRVVMMAALSDYYTPAMWGGDKEAARKGFARAAALFATDRPAPLYPNWGHDEVYAWIGVMKRDEGDVAGARQAFERALELNPEYGWVRYQLLPSLAN